MEVSSATPPLAPKGPAREGDVLREAAREAEKEAKRAERGSGLRSFKRASASVFESSRERTIREELEALDRLARQNTRLNSMITRKLAQQDEHDEKDRNSNASISGAEAVDEEEVEEERVVPSALVDDGSEVISEAIEVAEERIFSPSLLEPTTNGKRRSSAAEPASGKSSRTSPTAKTSTTATTTTTTAAAAQEAEESEEEGEAVCERIERVGMREESRESGEEQSEKARSGNLRNLTVHEMARDGSMKRFRELYSGDGEPDSHTSLGSANTKQTGSVASANSKSTKSPYASFGSRGTKSVRFFDSSDRRRTQRRPQVD